VPRVPRSQTKRGCLVAGGERAGEAQLAVGTAEPRWPIERHAALIGVEVVDADAGPEFSPCLHDGMGRDAAAESERRAGFDDRERTDLDVGGESGGRVDLGGRVNHFGGLAPPNSSSWAALTIS